MTSDARTSTAAVKALATGLATGMPLLLAPQVALAQTADTIVVASVSGLVGTTCGALLTGVIGHVLHARDRRDLERVVSELLAAGNGRGEATASAPSTAASPAVMPVAPTPLTSIPPIEPEAVASVPVVPASSAPHLSLIDSLPEPSLRIVEPVGPVRQAKESESAPHARDLDFLPDPFDEPAPAAPRVATPAAGPEVAPGHGAVTAASLGSEPNLFVPSASNPYLQAMGETERAPRRAMAPEPAPGTGDDYEDIASSYVARKGLRERMTVTAKGVAAVLGERMGRSMMDDLPVITRADGSVADVGTTWWEQDERVQQSVQGQPPAMQVPAVDPPVVDVPAPQPTPGAEAEERSRLIVSRVAPVEQEAYPEIGFDWRRREDVWESALAALDERVEDNLVAVRDDRARRLEARLSAGRVATPDLRVSPPVESASFGDAVGAIDTIDEPDGLELETQFLNFRAPGNHPEVQDTGSYINYLIEDEFRQNPSSQVRRKARSYLRVHEGGQNTRAQAM